MSKARNKEKKQKKLTSLSYRLTLTVANGNHQLVSQIHHGAAQSKTPILKTTLKVRIVMLRGILPLKSFTTVVNRHAPRPKTSFQHDMMIG